jgi:hypothetical protein
VAGPSAAIRGVHDGDHLEDVRDEQRLETLLLVDGVQFPPPA